MRINMEGSLFSKITGFNPSTVKEYANQQEFKADEETGTDYSLVDFTVGCYSDDEAKNLDING